MRGGQHLFNATWLAPEGSPGKVAVRLSHKGFPIPATPRFVWPGMRASDGWLPEARIEADYSAWPPPPWAPEGKKPVAFDLWDKNRFFRLYMEARKF